MRILAKEDYPGEMNKMLNQCNFIGRLGRDPESRFTSSGKQVANVSIACSEKRNGQEFTEWVNVIFWEKLAEIVVEYLGKGSLVFVSGKMQTRSWEDANGVKKYTTEIVAREMKMLSGSSGSGSGSGTGGQRSEGYSDPPPMGDDVPF